MNLRNPLSAALVVALLQATCGCVDRSALAVAGPRESLVGTWRVTDMTVAGVAQPIPVDDRYRFARGVVTIQTAGNPPQQLGYRSDEGKSPRTLDMTYVKNGQQQIASMVYAVVNDRLTICYPRPGQPRPVGLTSTAENRHTLIVFRRMATPTETVRADQAREPSAPSPFSRAMDHYLGTAGVIDFSKAKPLFQLAARQGDVRAKLWIARFCMDGSCGFEKDVTRADVLARTTLASVEKLAAGGDDQAMLLMGKAAHLGLGREQDYAPTLRWYGRAEQAGNFMAATELAWLYISVGEVKTSRAAPEPLTSAVRQHLGNSQASRDWLLREAVRLLQSPADRGYPAAMRMLGYVHGTDIAQIATGKPTEVQVAIRWYEKAAAAGDGTAAYNIATLHQHGRDVPRNVEGAVKWFEVAAERGKSYAMFDLALLYETGDGVPQDLAQALAWYQRASDAGHADAMSNLGIMYHDGRGVERDYLAAARWFEQAIEAGSSMAMLNLAHLHQLGLGVQRNNNRAQQLIARSARTGNIKAQRLLRRSSAPSRSWSAPARPSANPTNSSERIQRAIEESDRAMRNWRIRHPGF